MLMAGLGAAARRVFALGAAALIACSAQAGEVSALRFRIITGDSSELSQRIATDLRRRLTHVYAALQDDDVEGRRTVVVAIGPTALREAMAKPCECVLVAAYTSSQVWHAHTAALPAARMRHITAIYAEPAPADQLQLAELLFKRPVRVFALLSPETAFLKPVLAGVADIYDYPRGEDINRFMSRITQARVLLAVPDSAVYTEENIRSILLSTYRHNQAVIGFSADMVKAGALASTYSDIDQINAHVADVVGEYIASGELPAPQFPRYFSTIVNEGVARSLDVYVDAVARNFANHPPRTPIPSAAKRILP
ncbi:MAG: hypothetical protein ACLGI6_16910 [Gammaproteobacteria bacterium]